MYLLAAKTHLTHKPFNEMVFHRQEYRNANHKTRDKLEAAKEGQIKIKNSDAID